MSVLKKSAFYIPLDACITKTVSCPRDDKVRFLNTCNLHEEANTVTVRLLILMTIIKHNNNNKSVPFDKGNLGFQVNDRLFDGLKRNEAFVLNHLMFCILLCVFYLLESSSLPEENYN